MTDLELMLRAAGGEIQWPPTPDLAAAIGESVRAPRADRAPVRLAPRRLRIRRPLTLALAALLLLAATAAAVPGIREPVLDFLGLRSVKIERVPAPLPAAVPGEKLSLGDRTTLAGARGRLGFTPLVPDALDTPVVYYDAFPPGGQLGLVYRGGKLFITEVQGRLERDYLFKFVGPDARVDPVDVNGGRGVWIHGQPHQYAFADRTGNLHTDSIRLAGDVLLWRSGGLLLRLEGARSKAEALRIARSARASP